MGLSDDHVRGKLRESPYIHLVDREGAGEQLAEGDVNGVTSTLQHRRDLRARSGNNRQAFDAWRVIALMRATDNGLGQAERRDDLRRRGRSVTIRGLGSIPLTRF